MHKQRIIFFTSCWNAFVTHFLMFLRLSVYRYFDPNLAFFNSCIDRRPHFSCFLSSHIFDQIHEQTDAIPTGRCSDKWNVLELMMVYALILDIVPLKWIRPNCCEHFLTHFTSQVGNYYDAIFGYFPNSSTQKHDEIAFQQKVKKMIFCLWIV